MITRTCIKSLMTRKTTLSTWCRCAGSIPLRRQAFSEVGLFGNQNTVCKPTAPKWSHTVNRLKQMWPLDVRSPGLDANSLDTVITPSESALTLTKDVPDYHLSPNTQATFSPLKNY